MDKDETKRRRAWAVGIVVLMVLLLSLQAYIDGSRAKNIQAATVETTPPR